MEKKFTQAEIEAINAANEVMDEDVIKEALEQEDIEDILNVEEDYDILIKNAEHFRKLFEQRNNKAA